MSATTARLRFPARSPHFGTGVAVAAFLAFAPLPASAAVATQPGLMHSLGQQLDMQTQAEVFLVRDRRSARRSSARRSSSARRARSRTRVVIRDRRPRREYYYFAFPLVVPPPAYYTPRPYVGGQCDYWHRRCVANWGYSNSNYRGCMRYHGCPAY